MTLVVPFDDSELAKAALVRARQFDEVLNEGVVAVTVIPVKNNEFARERGWIGPDESFDGTKIIAALESSVTELAPDAEFEYITVDRWAPRGTMSNRLIRFARDVGATIVFIGSENAGRLASSLTIGSSVGSYHDYDTMIISNPELPEIRTLEELAPSDEHLD